MSSLSNKPGNRIDIDIALASLIPHQQTGGFVKRYHFSEEQEDASSCSTESISSTEDSCEEWTKHHHRSRPSLDLNIMNFHKEILSSMEDEEPVQLLTRPKHHKKQNHSILSIPSLHDNPEDDEDYSSDEDDSDSVEEFCRDQEEETLESRCPDKDHSCQEDDSDLKELTLMQFIRGQRILREQRLKNQQEAQALLPCLKKESPARGSSEQQATKKSVCFAYNPDAKCVWTFVNKPRPVSAWKGEPMDSPWYSRTELQQMQESQALERQLFEPIYNRALTQAIQEACEQKPLSFSAEEDNVLSSLQEHFSSPSLYYNNLRGMEVDCCGLLADRMGQHELSIMKLCDVQWEGTTLFESGANNDVADAALLRLQSLKVSRSSARLAQALAAWDRQEANAVYQEHQQY